MKISAKLAMILAAPFVAVCLGFAITGFLSLGEIADPIQMADAKGFAWFWTFLAFVAGGFGVLSWWIAQTQTDDGDG